MKAVIYHADSAVAKNYPPDTYKNLFALLKSNLKKFNIPLIHLTLNGHEGWGDENFFYDRDPNDIVYNREDLFLNFLKNSNDDVYWFLEPDHKLITVFPELSTDLALLIRNDSTPITPSWRLARKTAIPFFEELLDIFILNRNWNGDSVVFYKMWEKIGSPLNPGIIKYKDLLIELRSYKQYSTRKSQYSQQFKGLHKFELLSQGNK
jgi:hypothetical protein